MANYEAKMRSSYFKVKDPEEFKKWIASFDLEVWERSDGLFAFGGDTSIPDYIEDLESEETIDIDFAGELSTHLEEGWVAIIQEIGSEKLRYLNGYACAVNWMGTFRSVNIDDIQDQARQIGEHVENPTY
jgi:hypothetical protein